MRCKNLSVTFSIQVPVDEPDDNGNIYTEEAIIEACKNASGQPIEQYNEKGESVAVGVANKVEYSNGFIWVEGRVWHGGTSEIVDIIDGKVTSMRITGLGIGT